MPDSAARSDDISALPLTAALEALPDPVLIVRGGPSGAIVDARIAFANAAARALPRAPLPETPLIAAFRQPDLLDAVDGALTHGHAASAVLEEGVSQLRFWQVFASPLPTPEGRPEGRYALVFLRDETEARRGERTRADFLANASHELRTPLASLTGYIETLRGPAHDDEAARDRFLAIMQAQAARMGRLIEDLLSLSRIELSEHVPPIGRCDLALAASDVLDALRPMVAARGVTLALEAPAKAAVVGDRDQVVQVVQNLVDNALTYSPEGGEVRIVVGEAASLPALDALRDPVLAQSSATARLTLAEPDRTRASGGYVFVRVSDRGAGLARQHLPRLAERFYRVEGQKSGAGARPGTGLGLAIVKHIVHRHRGGLIVESAPGEGSAFTAYFPAEGR